MAYDLFFADGVVIVRCTSGKDSHMRKTADGWLVDEDPNQRLFQTRGAALDRARELAEDPDWP